MSEAADVTVGLGVDILVSAKLLEEAGTEEQLHSHLIQLTNHLANSLSHHQTEISTGFTLAIPKLDTAHLSESIAVLKAQVEKANQHILAALEGEDEHAATSKRVRALETSKAAYQGVINNLETRNKAVAALLPQTTIDYEAILKDRDAVQHILKEASGPERINNVRSLQASLQLEMKALESLTDTLAQGKAVRHTLRTENDEGGVIHQNFDVLPYKLQLENIKTQTNQLKEQDRMLTAALSVQSEVTKKRKLLEGNNSALHSETYIAEQFKKIGGDLNSKNIGAFDFEGVVKHYNKLITAINKESDAAAKKADYDTAKAADEMLVELGAKKLEVRQRASKIKGNNLKKSPEEHFADSAVSAASFRELVTEGLKVEGLSKQQITKAQSYAASAEKSAENARNGAKGTKHYEEYALRKNSLSQMREEFSKVTENKRYEEHANIIESYKDVSFKEIENLSPTQQERLIAKLKKAAVGIIDVEKKENKQGHNFRNYEAVSELAKGVLAVAENYKKSKEALSKFEDLKTASDPFLTSTVKGLHADSITDPDKIKSLVKKFNSAQQIITDAVTYGHTTEGSKEVSAMQKLSENLVALPEHAAGIKADEEAAKVKKAVKLVEDNRSITSEDLVKEGKGSRLKIVTNLSNALKVVTKAYETDPSKEVEGAMLHVKSIAEAIKGIEAHEKGVISSSKALKEGKKLLSSAESFLGRNKIKDFQQMLDFESSSKYGANSFSSSLSEHLSALDKASSQGVAEKDLKEAREALAQLQKTYTDRKQLKANAERSASAAWTKEFLENNHKITAADYLAKTSTEKVEFLEDLKKAKGVLRRKTGAQKEQYSDIHEMIRTYLPILKRQASKDETAKAQTDREKVEYNRLKGFLEQHAEMGGGLSSIKQSNPAYFSNLSTYIKAAHKLFYKSPTDQPLSEEAEKLKNLSESLFNSLHASGEVAKKSASDVGLAAAIKTVKAHGGLTSEQFSGLSEKDRINTALELHAAIKVVNDEANKAGADSNKGLKSIPAEVTHAKSLADSIGKVLKSHTSYEADLAKGGELKKAALADLQASKDFLEKNPLKTYTDMLGATKYEKGVFSTALKAHIQKLNNAEGLVPDMSRRVATSALEGLLKTYTNRDSLRNADVKQQAKQAALVFASAHPDVTKEHIEGSYKEQSERAALTAEAKKALKALVGNDLSTPEIKSKEHLSTFINNLVDASSPAKAKAKADKAKAKADKEKENASALIAANKFVETHHKITSEEYSGKSYADKNKFRAEYNAAAKLIYQASGPEHSEAEKHADAIFNTLHSAKPLAANKDKEELNSRRVANALAVAEQYKNTSTKDFSSFGEVELKDITKKISASKALLDSEVKRSNEVVDQTKAAEIHGRVASGLNDINTVSGHLAGVEEYRREQGKLQLLEAAHKRVKDNLDTLQGHVAGGREGYNALGKEDQKRLRGLIDETRALIKGFTPEKAFKTYGTTVPEEVHAESYKRFSSVSEEFSALSKAAEKQKAARRAVVVGEDLLASRGGLGNSDLHEVDRADRGPIRAALQERYYAAHERIRAIETELANPAGHSEERISSLRHELDSLHQTLPAIRAGMNSLGGSISGVGGMAREAGQAIQQFAKYTLIYGTGYKILSAGSNLFGSALELDKELHAIRAISGAGRDEMASIEDAIKNVSEASEFSTAEIGSAAKVLAQAGISADKIPSTLAVTSKLSATTGSGMEVSATVLTSLLDAFEKNSSGDTAGIADKLAQTVNISKLTMDSLRTILSLTASSAKAANVSEDQLLGYAATLSNKGIKDSTIATGLREAMVELLSPDAKTLSFLSSRYKAIGETISEASIKHKFMSFREEDDPLRAAFDELNRLGVSGTAKNEFNRITERRAENVIFPLLSSLSTSASNIASVSQGHSIDAGEVIQMEALVNSASGLWSALTSLTHELTVGLYPSVTKFFTALKDVTEWLRERAMQGGIGEPGKAVENVVESAAVSMGAWNLISKVVPAGKLGTAIKAATSLVAGGAYGALSPAADTPSGTENASPGEKITKEAVDAVGVAAEVGSAALLYNSIRKWFLGAAATGAATGVATGAAEVATGAVVAEVATGAVVGEVATGGLVLAGIALAPEVILAVGAVIVAGIAKAVYDAFSPKQEKDGIVARANAAVAKGSQSWATEADKNHVSEEENIATAKGVADGITTQRRILGEAITKDEEAKTVINRYDDKQKDSQPFTVKINKEKIDKATKELQSKIPNAEISNTFFDTLLGMLEHVPQAGPSIELGKNYISKLQAVSKNPEEFNADQLYAMSAGGSDLQSSLSGLEEQRNGQQDLIIAANEAGDLRTAEQKLALDAYNNLNEAHKKILESPNKTNFDTYGKVSEALLAFYELVSKLGKERTEEVERETEKLAKLITSEESVNSGAFREYILKKSADVRKGVTDIMVAEFSAVLKALKERLADQPDQKDGKKSEEEVTALLQSAETQTKEKANNASINAEAKKQLEDDNARRGVLKEDSGTVAEDAAKKAAAVQAANEKPLVILNATATKQKKENQLVPLAATLKDKQALNSESNAADAEATAAKALDEFIVPQISPNEEKTSGTLSHSLSEIIHSDASSKDKLEKITQSPDLATAVLSALTYDKRQALEKASTEIFKKTEQATIADQSSIDDNDQAIRAQDYGTESAALSNDAASLEKEKESYSKNGTDFVKLEETLAKMAELAARRKALGVSTRQNTYENPALVEEYKKSEDINAEKEQTAYREGVQRKHAVALVKEATLSLKVTDKQIEDSVATGAIELIDNLVEKRGELAKDLDAKKIDEIARHGGFLKTEGDPNGDKERIDLENDQARVRSDVSFRARLDAYKKYDTTSERAYKESTVKSPFTPAEEGYRAGTGQSNTRAHEAAALSINHTSAQDYLTHLNKSKAYRENLLNTELLKPVPDQNAKYIAELTTEIASNKDAADSLVTSMSDMEGKLHQLNTGVIEAFSEVSAEGILAEFQKLNPGFTQLRQQIESNTAQMLDGVSGVIGDFITSGFDATKDLEAIRGAMQNTSQAAQNYDQVMAGRIGMLSAIQSSSSLVKESPAVQAMIINQAGAAQLGAEQAAKDQLAAAKREEEITRNENSLGGQVSKVFGDSAKSMASTLVKDTIGDGISSLLNLSTHKDTYTGKGLNVYVLNPSDGSGSPSGMASPTGEVSMSSMLSQNGLVSFLGGIGDKIDRVSELTTGEKTGFSISKGVTQLAGAAEKFLGWIGTPTASQYTPLPSPATFVSGGYTPTHGNYSPVPTATPDFTPGHALSAGDIRSYGGHASFDAGVSKIGSAGNSAAALSGAAAGAGAVVSIASSIYSIYNTVDAYSDSLDYYEEVLHEATKNNNKAPEVFATDTTSSATTSTDTGYAAIKDPAGALAGYINSPKYKDSIANSLSPASMEGIQDRMKTPATYAEKGAQGTSDALYTGVQQIAGAIASGQKEGAKQQNVRVVNVVDPSLVHDFMSSASGEKVLLNSIQRNASAIKNSLR
jgi:hypothetical protein